MSHDQKPTKMRLTAGGGAPSTVPPARRRGDTIIDNAAPANGAPLSGVATASPRVSAHVRTHGVALALLFVVGCVAGGIALPLTGWL